MSENEENFKSSSTYIKNLNDTGKYKALNLDIDFNSPTSEKASTTTTSLAITIVTVSRRSNHMLENYAPKYLTQSVAAFLTLLNTTISNAHFRVGLFVCNVETEPESRKEVKALPKWISSFERTDTKHQRSQTKYNSTFDKEKKDYIFCLEKSLAFNVSHVLLVEDDAIPLQDLFPVLDLLVFSNYSNANSQVSKEVTYFKLYHPERLLGFISLEWERIPELLSLSSLMSLLLLRIYTLWRPTYSNSLCILWILFFIYSTLTLLMLGRTNLMALRKISKYLYQVTPAPSYCTQAMLFSRKGGQLAAEHLKSVTCRKGYAKDIALEGFIKKKELTAKMIQPNLFKHIGQISSLRPRPLNPYIL